MADEQDKGSKLDTAFIVTIPDEYLIMIGRINVAWGMLESAVDLTLAKLTSFELFDPRHAILTAHMTWPLKMDILESLVNALKDDFPRLKEFIAVKPRLTEAQNGRNIVSHGQWAYEDGQVFKLRATARGKIKVSTTLVTLSELENTFNVIGVAGRMLLNLVLKTKSPSGEIVPDKPP